MGTSSQQPITEDLRQWIVSQAQAGCLPEDVIRAMVASGWHEDVAVRALEETLRGHLQALRQPLPEAATAVPGPRLLEGQSLLEVEGQAVQVLSSMQVPRVVVFANLLTGAECEELMAQAAPRLLRSETVDTATGGSEVNAARTSDGMFFERGQTPLIARIERRIATLLHWPLENGEGLQILRYRPGAQYKPHNDYFDPALPGTPKILERGGQRVGTLVMYLNSPLRGGATTFPDAGLEVAAVRGGAVFFSYDRPHASTKTLHGGAPVLEGEKWVATKWLRERVFT